MQEFLIDNTPMYQVAGVYAAAVGGLIYGVSILYRMLRRYKWGVLHVGLWSRTLLGIFLTVAMSASLWVLVTPIGFNRIRIADESLELHRHGFRKVIVLPLKDIKGVHVKRKQRGRHRYQSLEIATAGGSTHASILCITTPEETNRLQNIATRLRQQL